MIGLLQRLAMRGGAGGTPVQSNEAMPMTAPLRPRFATHGPPPQPQAQPEFGSERPLPEPMRYSPIEAAERGVAQAASTGATGPLSLVSSPPEKDRFQTLPLAVANSDPPAPQAPASLSFDLAAPQQKSDSSAAPQIVVHQPVADAGPQPVPPMAPEPQQGSIQDEKSAVAQTPKSVEAPHPKIPNTQALENSPARADLAHQTNLAPSPARATLVPEQRGNPPASAPSLTIGRIDVIFEAPSPPPTPPTPRARPDPPRTRGFEAFAMRRLSRRR